MAADPTEPTVPTVKTLFALSRNVCAFYDEDRREGCEERLTDPGWPSVKAIMCHIRGRRPGSARYDASMSDDERRAFENLILMCPTHSTVIDRLEPARFTVDVLRKMKESAMHPSDGWSDEGWRHRSAVLLLHKMRFLWPAEDAEIAATPPGSNVGAGFRFTAGGVTPVVVTQAGSPSPNP